MKILIQCNTVYQLLVACQLRHSIFELDSVDLLISTEIKAAKGFCDRIKSIRLFQNVWLENILKITKLSKLNIHLFARKRLGITDDFFNTKYDEIIISNPSLYNAKIISIFMKKNSKIVVAAYEDGLSSYSLLYKKIFFFGEKEHGKELLLKSFHNYFRKISKIYVFCPQYLLWGNNIAIKIPQIDINDQTFITQLNTIFEYKKDIDFSHVKSIFFEESYSVSNKYVNDLEIVNKIYQHYPEGFYIKKHPRCTSNRFSDINIHLLDCGIIPWEMFLINDYKNILNIKLFSIASGAIFSGYLLFGLKLNCFSCESMVNDASQLYPEIDKVRALIIKDQKSGIKDYLKYEKTID